MAATINLSTFTFTAEQVRNINELVYEAINNRPDYDFIHRHYSGIVFDKEVGFITGGGLVGKAAQGCNPETQDWTVGTRKVTWQPKGWEVFIDECAADLENTMVVYAMNKGTRVDDLTDTDYMAIVVEVLTDAVMKAIFRIIWFSDAYATAVEYEDVYTATPTEQTAGSAIVGTVYLPVTASTAGAVKCALANDTVIYLSGSAATGNAESGKTYYSKSATKNKTIDNGGTYTEDIDTDYFTIIDGLFKQLRVIVTADASAGYTIAANNEDTYAEQLSALTPDVAYAIISGMYYKAKPALRARKSQMRFLVTQTIADKYEQYLTGKGISETYKNLVDGVDALSFNGIPVIPLPLWDEMIQAYQDMGTYWYKPHRALLTIRDVIATGTPSEQYFDFLDLWYDKTSRKNYVLVKDKIDAKVLNPDLVVYGE